MDFQLTEEQQYFRRLVRDFAETELKPLARHTDEADDNRHHQAARPSENEPKERLQDLPTI